MFSLEKRKTRNDMIAEGWSDGRWSKLFSLLLWRIEHKSLGSKFKKAHSSKPWEELSDDKSCWTLEQTTQENGLMSSIGDF